MTNQFYDLKFNREPDGSICLEQQFGVDEPRAIYLHPEQLLFVARRLCGMKPETAGKVAELERRIAVLTDRLHSFICNEAFRSDLIERIGEGFEYLAKLDGLLDLAIEFDGGRLEPEIDQEPEPATATDKPTGKASPMPTPVTASHADVTAGHAMSRAGRPAQPFELTHPA